MGADGAAIHREGPRRRAPLCMRHTDRAYALRRTCVLLLPTDATPRLTGLQSHAATGMGQHVFVYYGSDRILSIPVFIGHVFNKDSLYKLDSVLEDAGRARRQAPSVRRGDLAVTRFAPPSLLP